MHLNSTSGGGHSQAQLQPQVKTLTVDCTNFQGLIIDYMYILPTMYGGMCSNAT